MSDTRAYFENQELTTGAIKAKMVDAVIQIAEEYGLISSAESSVSVDYDTPLSVECYFGINLRLTIFTDKEGGHSNE